MAQLILLRHGESTWNQENRFTGWTDVLLTPLGEQQARQAGETLRREKMEPKLVFTSVLTRAIHTTWRCLDAMQRAWLPVLNDWRLNERHYGALQGLNKSEMAKQYGEEQVLVWRRSYDTPPPALEASDPRCERSDPRYAANASQVPLTECLKDTVARVLPCWKERLAPALREQNCVLVSAHGNSIRALVMMLDNISPADIVGLNIPNGVPLLYELDAQLRPTSHRYLGDAEAIAKAQAAVASQGKAR